MKYEVVFCFWDFWVLNWDSAESLLYNCAQKKRLIPKDHEISEMETIATSDEETPQGSEFENNKQTGVLMVSI